MTEEEEEEESVKNGGTVDIQELTESAINRPPSHLYPALPPPPGTHTRARTAGLSLYIYNPSHISHSPLTALRHDGTGMERLMAGQRAWIMVCLR